MGSRFLTVIGLTLALTATSCNSGPKGIGEPDIDELVGVIRRSSTKLLEAERNARGGTAGAEDVWVAVLPMSVKGDYDFGANSFYFNNSIEEAVANSAMFRPVVRNLIDVGVQEAGISDPEQLFLRQKREAFQKALTDQGFVPAYFILAELTTLTQRKSGYVSDRIMNLSLKLVDSATGELAQSQSDELRQN